MTETRKCLTNLGKLKRGSLGNTKSYEIPTNSVYVFTYVTERNNTYEKCIAIDQNSGL